MRKGTVFLPQPLPNDAQAATLHPLSLKERCSGWWTSAFGAHIGHTGMCRSDPFPRSRRAVGFESHPGPEDTKADPVARQAALPFRPYGPGGPLRFKRPTADQNAGGACGQLQWDLTSEAPRVVEQS